MLNQFIVIMQNAISENIRLILEDQAHMCFMIVLIGMFIVVTSEIFKQMIRDDRGW